MVVVEEELKGHLLHHKSFFFNNKGNPKNILLVSGVVSTNTYLIKKNILIDKNNTLYHVYAFNKNDLDSKLKKIEFSNYDLIILDSFLEEKILVVQRLIYQI